MCIGFEENAYGAIYGLLNFRFLSLDARHAWDIAVSEAASLRSETSSFRSRENVFYGLLRQTRLGAFGVNTDNKSINDSSYLVANPWCLTDREFEYCYVYVNDGNAVSIEEFDKSFLNKDQQEWLGIGMPVGQYFLLKMLKQYAPKVILIGEGVAERLSLPLMVAGVVKAVADHFLDKWEAKEMKRLYSIDAVRREYLKSIDQGTYRGLVATK
ncbi:MAG: hypothetical protein PW843_09700 [Azospirillaceae bacterium]|nr:hypothetical protein [Azospirillaceae bacterium]